MAYDSGVGTGGWLGNASGDYGIPMWLSALGGGAGNLAGRAGNWASNNPMDALSLGAGAAGTGFGIWDIVRANQDASNRDFQTRHWLMRHPSGSYMPQLTDAVRAAMVRPSAANLATAGLDPSGGAFTQGITDSLSKQYSDLYNQSEGQRLNDYQAFVLGQGQPRQSMGSVAGLPQALQNMQIMQALRQQPQQQTTGAASTANLPGGQPDEGLGTVYDYQLEMPYSQLGRGLGTGSSFNYPQDAMAGSLY